MPVVKLLRESIILGPVVQKAINVNLGLNDKQGLNFSGLKCPNHVIQT